MICVSLATSGKSKKKVETAPLQSVGKLPFAVAGKDHNGDVLRLQRAQLRYGNLKIGEDLKEKSLKFGIAFINLVDEQDHLVRGADCL
jgi:hypothetical protein